MGYKKEIEKLNKCLHDYCHQLYIKLQPPLTLLEIERNFKDLGIDDENLLDIFLWKNGIPYDINLPTHSYDFTGFGVIPPLRYIAEIIKIEITDQSWRNSLFPLVVSYGGDFLLYETNKRDGNYGKLFLYSPNLGYVDYQISYFDSIGTMIETIVNSFEKKILVYDNETMSLDITDYSLRSEISKKLNPKSEYWRI